MYGTVVILTDFYVMNLEERKSKLNTSWVSETASRSRVT